MSLEDPDLSALIRRHASRHTAPATLRAGLRTQVALAEAGRAAPRRGLGGGWRLATLSFVLGAAGMLLVLSAVERLDFGAPPDADLVAHHVRALQIGPLTEVASTDRHTVKPWFQGRLDFAPPVFDLAADGFPLLGGRVEHLRGGAVAALAYTRNRHVIDVFVWPGTAPQPPRPSQHRGFNVLHWADGSMQVWAVSDLERAELARFAQRWQAQAATP